MATDGVRDVIAVGAGHNGLVATAYLTRGGRDVLAEGRHLAEQLDA